MLLSELARCVGGARIVCGAKNMQTSENTQIRGLTADSRFCSTGDLFFCLTGGKTDSHVYARDAEEAGAAAVVTERELELKIPQLVVPDSRAAMGLIASAFYDHAAEKLKIIGITGTNGKTTTSYMLASVLRRAGKTVAVVGTLGIYYGKKQIAPELTTPDPLFLHKMFADMVKSGVEYVVAEVSAHALFYRKEEGIPFAACIFTNFTQDHLDFFQTMEKYKAAKKLLFTPERCPIAVLNGDDAVGREIGGLRGESDKAGKTSTVFYGLETPAEAFAVITSEELYGCEFMLNLSDNLCRISLPMTGRHNVYNAMAAAACAYALGIRTEAIAGGLSGMKPVRGRLEPAGKFHGADIFVDFAHTPDGLEKSLAALKSHCKGRLICLFGCGGNRSKLRRSKMGETAGHLADLTILTSDNPRWEDPEEILDDIEDGIRGTGGQYVRIADRREAVRYAMAQAMENDMLVLAGKGHEAYQEIRGVRYPLSEYELVEEARRSPDMGENTDRNEVDRWRNMRR